MLDVCASSPACLPNPLFACWHVFVVVLSDYRLVREGVQDTSIRHPFVEFMLKIASFCHSVLVVHKFFFTRLSLFCLAPSTIARVQRSVTLCLVPFNFALPQLPPPRTTCSQVVNQFKIRLTYQYCMLLVAPLFAYLEPGDLGDVAMLSYGDWARIAAVACLSYTNVNLQVHCLELVGPYLYR